MQITVGIDTTRLKQDLAREQQRIVSAGRRAAFELAHRSVESIREGMRSTFNQPTAWVLNGVYVAPRRDQNSAEVAWRPGNINRGIPAEKILRAQIEGGARRQKRFERLLGLPADRIAVPGRWAEVDASGDLTGGLITEIISALRIQGTLGYNLNRGVSQRRRRAGGRQREFFLIPPGSEHRTLWPGIYRVAGEMGGAPLLVVAFVRRANYRARFAPARIVADTVRSNAAQVWDLALRRQLPFRR